MAAVVVLSYGLIGAPALVDRPEAAVAQSQPAVISWTQIRDWFQRKKVRGGRRNPLFCAIAPQLLQDDSFLAGTTPVEVWHLRPLFVWRGQIGAAGRLEVFQYDANQLLWNRPISSLNTSLLYPSLLYQGSALKPGQTYKWRVSSHENPNLPSIYSTILFQVVAAPKWQQMATELSQLSAQLKTQAATDETIAFRRASYFAERQLWSDVLQEVMGVPQPSSQLTQLRQDLTDQICGVRQ
jgi:hypothetical protein